MASKKLRVLALALAALMSIAILASCGDSSGTSGSGSDDPSTPTEGTTEIFWWDGFTSSDGELITSKVEEYNAMQDELKLSRTTYQWAVLFEKLPSTVATGANPRFVLWGPGNIPEYAAEGHLAEISGYWDVATNKDDFVEATLDMVQYDGKMYGVPFQIFTQVLYWNKDLFKEAGLNENEAPGTWDEMKTMAATIKENTSSDGFQMPVDNQLTLITKSFGGCYIDGTTHENKVEETRSAIESAWTWYKDAIDDGMFVANLTGEDVQQAFTAGQTAMYIGGPWQIAGNTEKGMNFSVTSTPDGGSNPRYVEMGMNNWSIFANATDTEKELLYKFMNWWQTDGNCAREWCTFNKFPAYLKSLREDPDIIADEFVSQTSEFIDVGTFIFPIPLKNDTIFNGDEYMNKVVKGWANGDYADVAAAVDDLKTIVDGYLADYEA